MWHGGKDGVRSRSTECGVRSAEYGVRSTECGVRSPVQFVDVALARTTLNFLFCGKIIINLGLSGPLLCCALCTQQRKYIPKSCSLKVCISKQQYSSDLWALKDKRNCIVDKPLKSLGKINNRQFPL